MRRSFQSSVSFWPVIAEQKKRDKKRFTQLSKQVKSKQPRPTITAAVIVFDWCNYINRLPSEGAELSSAKQRNVSHLMRALSAAICLAGWNNERQLEEIAAYQGDWGILDFSGSCRAKFSAALVCHSQKDCYAVQALQILWFASERRHGTCRNGRN